MATKIAILGTCVSEDWYHFQNVNKRLDVKILSFQPSSIISMMAAPVDIPINAGTEIKEREVARLKADFDKSFLQTLVDFKPDVLIVEVLADSRRGVIAVGDSWISRTFRIERTPMREVFAAEKLFTAAKQPEAYYKVFREAAKKLDTYLKANLPDCKIILNRARWSEYFVDDKGELKSYPAWVQNDYFVANLRLEALERIFKEEVRCDEISVQEVPVFADSRHIWGAASEHYIKPYYAGFSDRLGQITAQVEQAQRSAAEIQPPPMQAQSPQGSDTDNDSETTGTDLPQSPGLAGGSEDMESGRFSGLKGWTPSALLLDATAKDRSTDRSVSDVYATIRACAERWDLQLLSPFAQLTYNFVAPVISASHGPAVLKIAFATRKFHRESTALRLFDGDGAVKLLECDDSLLAMLLEKADPGDPMALDWDAHTAAFAGLVNRLWKPAPTDTDLPAVSREVRARVRDLEAMSRIVSSSQFSDRDRTIKKALEVIAELAASIDEQYVIHGDLHPYNVLSSHRASWLSIDPLGCIGERAFDVCAILRDDSTTLMESADPRAMVDRRIRELSVACGIDEARIRGWSFVEAVRTQGWRYRTGKPLEEWSTLISLTEP